ncbi:MAG: ATP-dependent sacrificial sulfur transferase LarE [Planctomycetes bacterium]|nr:ATP-dependent sacrificial sulfur transferase LarE [Planctomycetota bacterium]
MDQSLQKKYKYLITLIKELDSVVVAFSGGLDSTLLAFLTRRVLGDRARAVTATSETYTPAELAETRQLAGEFNLTHEVISTHELSCDDFAKNPINRCYYCKQELFKKLRKIADRENIKHVVDGTTLTDDNDYRPGRQAARELRVRSPLKEAGITKKEVRLISRLLGLPGWDKPSGACLASRFPYGEKITEEKLRQIAAAESYLKELDFKVVRVRHHQDIARIEVGQDELARFAEADLRDRVNQRFRQLGYTYVSIDLKGYRSGSMNKKINEAGKSFEPLTEPDLGIKEEVKKFLSLDCPTCRDHKLEEMNVAESKYKQCPHCGGAWFSINELEKAIGRGVKFSLPDNTTVENLPRTATPVCPVCQTDLIQIKAVGQADLVVSACLICQGRWMDGPEIARQQKKGFFSQIREMVMRLF